MRATRISPAASACQTMPPAARARSWPRPAGFNRRSTRTPKPYTRTRGPVPGTGKLVAEAASFGGEGLGHGGASGRPGRGTIAGHVDRPRSLRGRGGLRRDAEELPVVRGKGAGDTPG